MGQIRALRPEMLTKAGMAVNPSKSKKMRCAYSVNRNAQQRDKRVCGCFDNSRESKVRRGEGKSKIRQDQSSQYQSPFAEALHRHASSMAMKRMASAFKMSFRRASVTVQLPWVMEEVDASARSPDDAELWRGASRRVELRMKASSELT